MPKCVDFFKFSKYQNIKSEIRNPKQARNSKSETAAYMFRISCFGFVSYFVLRICFVFRVSDLFRISSFGFVSYFEFRI